MSWEPLTRNRSPMDGQKVGGEDSGPIPKQFVLTALAGCTGMDIAAILRKADKNPDDFDICFRAHKKLNQHSC